jgi:hypothetical protein
MRAYRVAVVGVALGLCLLGTVAAGTGRPRRAAPARPAPRPPAPSKPAPNQLLNPSFEQGMAHWDASTFSPKTVVQMGGVKGRLCAHMWNAPNENDFLWARQTVDVSGKGVAKAILRTHMKCENVQAQGWQKMLVRVYFRDAQDENLGSIDVSQDGTFDWKEIMGQADVPRGTTRVMVEFNLFQRPGHAWFDNVRLFLYGPDGTPLPGPKVPPATTPVSTGKGWAWWEGEAPVVSNATPTQWLDLDHEALSERRWWCSQQTQTEDNPLFAVYKVQVPEDGEYNLWVRDVYQRNTVRWRFGEGEWRVAAQVERKDETPLAQYRSAHWGYWGAVKLSKGPHEFEIRPLPQNVEQQTHYIAIDAFLLIKGRFRPMGRHKPGEKFVVDYVTPPMPERGPAARSGTARFTPVDFAKVVNRAFVDETEGDGKGGWTDQGPANSLTGFPTGRRTMADAVFDIVDPAANDGRACLVLYSNNSTWAPERAGISRVNASARSIYFLHATAFASAGETLAEYRVRFSDGKEEVIPVTVGKEVVDWWAPSDTSQMRVGWRGSNARSDNIGVCVYAWDNPSPEKTISAVEFVSLKANSIPIVIAVSLCDAPAFLPVSRETFVATAPPRKEDLYPFVPAPDDFGPAEVDLSELNDKPAGAHGFLRRDGDRLVFEDGTEARFWATNEAFTPSHEDADLLARRLAKVGVNCVRFHSLMSLVDESKPDTRHLDPVKMDRFDYLVAALKRHGIYVYFAMLYPHVKNYKPGDDLPQEVQGAGGVGFFNAEVIRENWNHFERILTHENKYTGTRYVDEPALAFVEIYNEDSLYWYSTDEMPSLYWKELALRFNTWLTMKYRTHAGLRAAWQVPGQPSPLGPDEDLGMTNVEPLKTWDYSDQWAPHLVRRGRDQIRFYYETESAFYRRTIGKLREWGLKCPVVTSNWKGTRHTQYAYLLTTTEGDVQDHHAYYSSGYTGRPFHATPMSRMPDAGNLSRIAFYANLDAPIVCTEWDAGPPHEYPYETVLMNASVGAMQGWDGLFQFAGFGEDWRGRLTFSPYFTTGLQNPNVQLIYPACALMFRRRDVAEADPVYERRVTPDQALDGEFVDGDYEVPLQALAVGRVGVRFADTPRQALVDPRASQIDPDSGQVTSAGRQIRWDYLNGRWTIDTPRTQAVTGQIDGATRTRDAEFTVDSPYGAVIVTSMTDDPIRTSRNVLVSLTARNFNNGARYNAERTVLEEEGTYPILMERLRGRLSLKTAHRDLTVVTCDPNGKALAQRKEAAPTGTVVLNLQLPPGAAYLVIKPAD